MLSVEQRVVLLMAVRDFGGWSFLCGGLSLSY